MQFTRSNPTVARDRTLSLQARAIYHILETFCFEAGVCYPSQNRLADHAGVNPRTLRRYLGELESAGHITMTRRRGTSVYRLTNWAGDRPNAERDQRHESSETSHGETGHTRPISRITTRASSDSLARSDRAALPDRNRTREIEGEEARPIESEQSQDGGALTLDRRASDEARGILNRTTIDPRHQSEIARYCKAVIGQGDGMAGWLGRRLEAELCAMQDDYLARGKAAFLERDQLATIKGRLQKMARDAYAKNRRLAAMREAAAERSAA